jgi:hypothetical protein
MFWKGCFRWKLSQERIMKAFFLSALVAGSLSMAVAQVSPEDHAAHHPDQAAGKAAAPPASATPAASPEAAVDKNQARMKAMQELMDKLGETKDPAERAKLLAQHRQAMHEQLSSMQHMGCSMMGDEAGKMGRMGTGEKGMSVKEGGGTMGQGMMSAGMMKCHEMMQMRMDMMVGMMDQMMRHEEAEHSAH